MKTPELIWIQEGFDYRAQGLLRVYRVKSEPLGINRFRPAIQRGAVTFICDVAFEGLDDAKHFCQSDHESIATIQADAREGCKSPQEVAAIVAKRDQLKVDLERALRVVSDTKHGMHSFRKWTRVEGLEKELSDTKTLLAHKNETANTFMEQVRKLQHQLTAHTEALKVAKEALQRVWEDSEMGWVTYVEYPNDKACVECRSLIPAQPHSADCLQSVVHAALATINDLLK